MDHFHVGVTYELNGNFLRNTSHTEHTNVLMAKLVGAYVRFPRAG